MKMELMGATNGGESHSFYCLKCLLNYPLFLMKWLLLNYPPVKKGLLLAITVIISIIKSVPERKIALSRDRSRDRAMV
jgi:hypothetical protein